MKTITSLSAARTLTLEAVFATVLAFTGIAHAGGRAHKGKTGHLKITAPTAVGDTVLQPGDYEVRELRDGQTVEFVRLQYVPMAPEGSWPYEEEVVARVKSTEQALSGPPKHTHLELALQTTSAAALLIRGNAVAYRFGPAQTAGEGNAIASHTDGAQ